MLVAFTLQAPGQHYPSHGHPARELYRVPGGTADWWRDNEDWLQRPPGSWVVHERFENHAMRSNDEPLLSLVVWMDDIDGVATFSD